MLTVLMNFVFVLAIGILIGALFAFEVFQRQLERTLFEYYLIKYFKEHSVKRGPIKWKF